MLQPGVVSMQEQRVLTKEAACFWSEERIGASLSSFLLTLRGTTAGAHVVMVVATVLVSVRMVGSGVLCGSG